MWYTGSSPRASLSHPGQPSKSQTPKHLRMEAQELQASPLGLAEQGSWKQVPQDEPNMGALQDRMGQGRAEQEGSIPSTQKDLMQISKSEIRLVLAQNPRMG